MESFCLFYIGFIAKHNLTKCPSSLDRLITLTDNYISHIPIINHKSDFVQVASNLHFLLLYNVDVNASTGIHRKLIKDSVSRYMTGLGCSL